MSGLLCPRLEEGAEKERSRRESAFSLRIHLFRRDLFENAHTKADFRKSVAVKAECMLESRAVGPSSILGTVLGSGHIEPIDLPVCARRHHFPWSQRNVAIYPGVIHTFAMAHVGQHFCRTPGRH